jgi:hypothetical protein
MGWSQGGRHGKAWVGRGSAARRTTRENAGGRACWLAEEGKWGRGGTRTAREAGMGGMGGMGWSRECGKEDHEGECRGKGMLAGRSGDLGPGRHQSSQGGRHGRAGDGMGWGRESGKEDDEGKCRGKGMSAGRSGDQGKGRRTSSQGGRHGKARGASTSLTFMPGITARSVAYQGSGLTGTRVCSDQCHPCEDARTSTQLYRRTNTIPGPKTNRRPSSGLWHGFCHHTPPWIANQLDRPQSVTTIATRHRGAL